MLYVEIELRNRKICYYAQPENIQLTPEKYVVCGVDRGSDIGKIKQFSIEQTQKLAKDRNYKVLKIIRLATESDVKHIDVIEAKEEEARNAFIAIEKNYDFEMKLLDTIYQFDMNKLTFFFAAETRIDFRDFVKELARNFQTRIELHQTSGRDEAKKLGGIGLCGRGYCCATFIKQFNQVTIKMAKDQNLTGNVTKFSGPCGRLLCCLNYEENYYVEQSKDFPILGAEVFIDGKKMYVFKNDYYNKNVHLSSSDEDFKSLNIEEFSHKCPNCPKIKDQSPDYEPEEFIGRKKVDKDKKKKYHKNKKKNDLPFLGANKKKKK